jgi:hypothetical protein
MAAFITAASYRYEGLEVLDVSASLPAGIAMHGTPLATERFVLPGTDEAAGAISTVR